MKHRYDTFLAKIHDRKDPVNRFINMLHSETTWLTSPASTKYHLNRESGLLEHSIGVDETLLQLRTALAPEMSKESCVIVGLFHDIGKVGMPRKQYYLPEGRSVAHKKEPLLLLLHWADMWTASVKVKDTSLIP